MAESGQHRVLRRPAMVQTRDHMDHLPWLSRMLKKSLFTSTQPGRAGTRLVPSFVLASLRGSPYQTSTHHLFASCGLACGTGRLGAPGWGGEMSGGFWGPAGGGSFC